MYYQLIGTCKVTGRTEIIFGDYDKDVVKEERQEHKQDYRSLQIVEVVETPAKKERPCEPNEWDWFEDNSDADEYETELNALHVNHPITPETAHMIDEVLD